MNSGVLNTIRGSEEADVGNQCVSLELKGKNLPRSTRSDFAFIIVSAFC